MAGKVKSALDFKRITPLIDQYLELCKACKQAPASLQQRNFWGYPKYETEVDKLKLKLYLLQEKEARC
jgi:hypothetical protein